MNPDQAAPLLATDTPDGQGQPARLSSWLAEHLPASPPLRYELIAAGGSNLTYRVVDRHSNQWALRRPPMAHALATAHDMSREWRIMSALAPNPAVPVPQCLAFCDDSEVIGAAFYVMSFVDGLILRDRASTGQMTAAQALAATQSLVKVQVAMHTIDLYEAGLQDLGRHQDYVGRQLKRWRRQVAQGGTRQLPLHEQLHDLLLAKMPPETARPALAHGDYRFDNCVLGPDFEVMAVLDWELGTTGNPIADFVWSLQYWGEPGDELTFLPEPPTFNPVFMRRQQYLELYQQQSGFDLSDLPYYQVFSWWKQASIVEGAYARRLAGATGGMATGGDVHEIAKRVDAMLRQAADWADSWL